MSGFYSDDTKMILDKALEQHLIATYHTTQHNWDSIVLINYKRLKMIIKKNNRLSGIVFYSINSNKSTISQKFPADNAAYGKTYAEFLKANCSREDCKQIAEKFPETITSGKAANYFPKIKALRKQCYLKSTCLSCFYGFGKLIAFFC